MPKGRATVKQIGGLLPALDPKQVQEPHILTGQNFLFTTEGPKSAFGGKLLSTSVISASPEHVYSFDIDDFIAYFTPEGVYVYNEVTEVYDIKLNLAPEWGTDIIARWTAATVGNKYYIANPNLGDKLIVYDPLGPTWSIFTSVDLPTGIYAVTQSIGRLVVLGADLYAWSALDNGQDLDPTGATGAGTQGLSIIGGTPLGIGEVDNGFLVYTTEGIISAQFIQLIVAGVNPVFRHDVFAREIKLINSLSFIIVDGDEHIALTDKGLHKIKHNSIEPYRPLFNQYIIDEIFKNLGDDLRLEYCNLRKLIYLSVRPNSVLKYYTVSYVLSEDLEKWGSFNRVHYSILTINSKSTVSAPACTGYVDAQSHLIIYTDEVQFESYIGGQVIQNSLDSFIHIGLMRFDEGETAFQLGEVQELSIGYSANPGNDLIIDYNLGVGVEDYELFTQEQDWGLDVPNVGLFDVTVVGTLDGVTQFEDNAETPFVVTQDDEAIYYTLNVFGLYFKVEIVADQLYQAFHIKTLELTGMSAGQLT